MAEKDGCHGQLKGKVTNSFTRAITENEELLTKLSNVPFQILILDKHHPELIWYQYPTSNFMNQDEARQSIVSYVRQSPSNSVAVYKFSTSVFGVYAYEGFVLVVVHQDGDKQLVLDHTKYLVERFKEEKEGLDTWYGEVERREDFKKKEVVLREDFKTKLRTFLKTHIESIFGKVKDMQVKDLLTKLPSVDFQILILDKLYIQDIRNPELIQYQYPTSNFMNQDEARQSIVSYVDQSPSNSVAVYKFSTSVFGVYAYERFVLVVVHQHADEKLVLDHTKYIVELFEKEKKGLYAWYRKITGREHFKKDLGRFLQKHIDSILSQVKDMQEKDM